MVGVAHFFDNGFCRQHPEPFLFDIQLHFKVGKVFIIEARILHPLGATVTFIPLEQGFSQRRLNRQLGQIPLSADVFNHVSKSGKGNHGHRGKLRIVLCEGTGGQDQGLIELFVAKERTGKVLSLAFKGKGEGSHLEF
jgi:hypothetical protein